MRKTRSRQRGFTLIELMVTVAVVAIMLMIAAPSFAEFLEKARLRAAADAVGSTLANARAEAVKRDRDIAVSFGASDAAWCMGVASALDPAAPGEPVPAAVACNCNEPAACLVGDTPFVVTSAQFGAVSLSSLPANFTIDSKLGTLSLATVPNTTATLTSSSGRFSLSVQVSPLGHIRTCFPAGSPAISGYSQCS